MSGSRRDSGRCARAGAVAAGALAALLLAVAAPAPGQAEGDDGPLARLRAMSLAERRRLSSELRRFETLPAAEQRAIRALDERIGQLPPEQQARYREVARTYYNWVRSRPEAEREALRSGSVDERQARVAAALRASGAADRGPDLDVTLARGSALNPLPFLDQVHAVRVWLALDAPRRQEIERAAPAERLRQLEELGTELGVADDRPELRRRVDDLLRDWSNGRGGPGGPGGFGGPGGLRKFDPSKAQAKGEALRRWAEARYLSRMTAEPVDAAELLRFADALPSWMRQSLDALPPAAAQERLRLIFRALWPTGTMPAEVKPWSSPVERPDRPDVIEPGPPPPDGRPRGPRPPGPPPPPGAPASPF
jgi:hypothetical protein